MSTFYIFEADEKKKDDKIFWYLNIKDVIHNVDVIDTLRYYMQIPK